MMDHVRIEARCGIAGGGPAGMMLGLLLARAGVDVLVLEKHSDFLRDFRGDTIHPSTLEVMLELGLLDRFLRIPHDEVRTLSAQIGDVTLEIVDLRHVPTHCKFLVLMPQWDFLDFLASEARRYPTFRLLMEAEATELIEEDGRIAGLIARTKNGSLEVRADLVVGADGRSSLVRAKAGLEVMDLGAPIDVLWLRLSRRQGDPQTQPFARIDSGRMLVLFNRRDYWQIAYVIPKGGADTIRAEGLPRFRETIASLVPWLRDRVEELTGWDDVKLLTVKVDRLRRWHRPGLLCIGDAAHAMSPIGGVGINLAIQDAVATANRLAPVLRRGAPTEADLHAVQRRREWPTRMTQRVQVFLQDRLITRALAGTLSRRLPLPLRLLRWFPFLRRIPARLFGVGFRPEHVRIPELRTTQDAGK
jgi:2-polyprenyl-6-methoxyphenol hydroxylase-like FAD-dependent oxidoreductase